MENSDRWTDAEVQALLNIFATEEIQLEFEGTKRNIKVFASIASQLAALGIQHTAKQCHDKIKKLKQDYKRIKDHNNQSGADRKSSKWYQLLDSILGHRPAYSGSAGTKDSADGLRGTLTTGSNSPTNSVAEGLCFEPNC